MELRYRVYMDGVLKDSPLNINEVKVIIERDDTIRGLLYKFTSELGFIGTGYTYILNQIQSQGAAAVIDVLIQTRVGGSAWTDLFDGRLFVTDIKIDLIKCIATGSIEDAGWTSKITNNKRIKAKLDVPISKNEVTIAAAASTDIDFFDPSDVLADYDYANLKCYSVNEAFRFIIDFISDGDISFSSTYFGSGDGRQWYITTGKVISGTDASDAPIINFEDLFMEIDKRLNISFRFENNTIYIEPTEDIFVETTMLTFADPEDANIQFDKSKMYAIIRFGSDITENRVSINANCPDVRFYGWGDEEYHVLGEQNIDNILDLKGDWKVDSNSIEVPLLGVSGTTDGTSAGKLIDSTATFNDGTISVGMNVYNLTDATVTTIDAIDSATQLDLASDIFVSGEKYKIASVTDYDSDIYIIQTDQPANARATKGDAYEPALNIYVYNLGLNNEAVSRAYLNGAPNSIAAFFTSPAEAAKAAMVSDVEGYSSNTVMVFDDIVTNGFDPSGNYNTGTYRYTAPLDGGYTVGCIFDYTVQGTATTTVGRAYIRQYDVGNNLIRELLIESFVAGVPPILFGGGAGTFYMQAGDYVQVEYDALATGGIQVLKETGSTLNPYSAFFINPTDEGGVYQTYNIEKYRTFLIEVNIPLTKTNWDIINAAQTQQIEFTLRGATYKGWIKRLEYEWTKGMANLILTTSQI